MGTFFLFFLIFLFFLFFLFFFFLSFFLSFFLFFFLSFFWLMEQEEHAKCNQVNNVMDVHPGATGGGFHTGAGGDVYQTPSFRNDPTAAAAAAVATSTSFASPSCSVIHFRTIHSCYR